MTIFRNNFVYVPNDSKQFKIYFIDTILLRKVYDYFPSPINRDIYITMSVLLLKRSDYWLLKVPRKICHEFTGRDQF